MRIVKKIYKQQKTYPYNNQISPRGKNDDAQI
jgi:hypothetical protein